MRKIIAFGDENGRRSLYRFPGKKESSFGFTVNSVATFKAFERLSRSYDVIFWLNSHPLIPASTLMKYPYFLKSEPSCRTVPSPTQGYRVSSSRIKYWNSLRTKQYTPLIKNYFEMNEYFMSKYAHKIVILPISAYLIDRSLNYSLCVCEKLLQYNWRVVDLSVLDGLFWKEVFTKKYVLDQIGYLLIEPEILKFTH